MLGERYPGYQTLSEGDFAAAWRDGRVVLDTNVLLGLYRYDLATRNELLRVLRIVSERLWMPYQVGLEYNRQRLSVISGEKRAFDKAAHSVDEHIGKVVDIFSDKSRNPHPSPALDGRLKELSELAKQIVAEVNTLGQALPDVHQHDGIRVSLSELYGTRIGAPPTKEWLESAESEAKFRLSLGIPPGFEDSKKSETYTDRGLTYSAQYGDFFVWKQILDEATASGWPALILVTDDSKIDWWYVESGKTIGPRAELREEVQRVASVPIFQTYSTAQFLEHANRHLNAQVSESSIALVREVAKPKEGLPSNFERLSKISRKAVHKWLRSTTSDDTKIIPAAEPFDFFIQRSSSRSAAIIKYVAGPPTGDLAPYILNGLARSVNDDAFHMGLEKVELYLVFSNRTALERHINTLLEVTQTLGTNSGIFRPKVGSLIRTNDGNYAYLPFELGVFE